MRKMQSHKRLVRLFAVLAIVALIGAAWSSDSDDTTTTTAAASGGDATTTTAAASGGDATTTTAAASGGTEVIKLGVLSDCEGPFGGFHEADLAGVGAAFAEFGPNVAFVGGKTGTGEVIKAPKSEHFRQVDNAFFVGVAPINQPRWVVSVVIERGGSGGRVAAPVARQVLQYLLNGADGVTELAPGLEAD